MKRKANQPAESEPAKRRLNHTFEELVNEDPLDVFSVLTSDQFWEDIKDYKEPDCGVDIKSFCEESQAQEPEICKESSLKFYWDFDLDLSDMIDSGQTETRRIDLILNSASEDCSDIYEILFTFDCSFCLLLNQIVQKKFSIKFSVFFDVFLKCIKLNKLGQAKFVIRIYLKNRSNRKLAREEESDLFEVVCRLILDSDYSGLTLDLVLLLRESFKTFTMERFLAASKGVSAVLEGFPYRAMAIGNFLSIVSHNLACTFYDCLLNGETIPIFEDYLCRVLNANFGQVQDIPKFTERLLLLASRMACTDNLHNSCEILQSIRALKATMPRGIVARALGTLEALTRMSGFLIAHEQK